MNNALYPKYVTWVLELGNARDFAQIIGSARAQRLRATLKQLTQSDYHFVIDSFEVSYLEKFILTYEAGMRQRGGTVFNVRADIEHGLASGATFETISLTQKNHYLGGIIYSITLDSLSAAFQILPRTLDINLPISLSYVADHYLVQRAFALEKKRLFKGLDRNIYGYPTHSAIGVADYKLLAGYVPFSSTVWDNSFQKLETLRHLKQDALVFLADHLDQRITDAVLFVMQDSSHAENKYTALLHHPNIRVSKKLVH